MRSSTAMPRQRSYDALLIDLDGVLRRWPDDDAALEAAHGLPPGCLRATAFEPTRLVPAITGAIDDALWRERICAALAERLHLALPRARAAVQSWSAEPGEPAADVLGLLDDCEPALRIVLVTNATSRLQADLDTLRLSGLFHAIVNSSAVGAAKPDARIFDAALAAAGCAADRALMIDDSAANVAAAQALGLAAHRFVDARTLRSCLAQAGLLRADAPDRDALLRDAAALVADGAAAATAGGLDAIGARLAGLARDHADALVRHRVARRGEERLLPLAAGAGAALYLVCDGPGTRSAAHVHDTWVAIAGVRGCEANQLFEPAPDAPSAAVPTRRVLIGPGDVLVLDDAAIHATEVVGDAPTCHLHLYGRALHRLAPFDARRRVEREPRQPSAGRASR